MDESWMVLEWHWTISDGFWKSMSFMCFWYLPTKWLIRLSLFLLTLWQKIEVWGPEAVVFHEDSAACQQCDWAAKQDLLCAVDMKKVTARKAVRNYEFAVNPSVSSPRPVDEWLITSCGSARNHHVCGELAWYRSASIWAHRPIVFIKSQTHCHFKGNLLNHVRAIAVFWILIGEMGFTCPCRILMFWLLSTREILWHAEPLGMKRSSGGQLLLLCRQITWEQTRSLLGRWTWWIRHVVRPRLGFPINVLKGCAMHNS